MKALPAALAALLVCACSSAPRRLPDAAQPQSIDGLVALLAARDDSLKNLSARLRIDLRIDGVRQKGVGLVAYRAPGMLKLNVRDRLLGVGVLEGLVLGDSLAVYLPRDNRYLQGNSVGVLYDITGVNLEYYDVRRALLGLPNLTSSDIPRATRFETRRDTLFVEVLDALWTRQILFHARTATLLEERVYSPRGHLLSTRRLRDYRMEGGIPLPRSVEIVQGRDRIEITFTHRSANKGVPGERFRLRLPSDATSLEPEL